MRQHQVASAPRLTQSMIANGKSRRMLVNTGTPMPVSTCPISLRLARIMNPDFPTSTPVQDPPPVHTAKSTRVFAWLKMGWQDLLAAKGISLLHGLLVVLISYAVLATTLSIVAVFVPVAFIPGMTGMLYNQFALTIAMAVGLSGFKAVVRTDILHLVLMFGGFLVLLPVAVGTIGGFGALDEITGDLIIGKSELMDQLKITGEESHQISSTAPKVLWPRISLLTAVIIFGFVSVRVATAMSLG